VVQIQPPIDTLSDNDAILSTQKVIRWPCFFDWRISTHNSYAHSRRRSYTTATRYSYKMAMVTTVDRMTSLSPY